MISIRTAIAIKDDAGTLVFGQNQVLQWESSSTIKIPILVMTVEKITRENTPLEHQLVRRPHHATKGSGILHWTALTDISLRDLISTTLIYSDCLATNMLIDFVGGHNVVNRWLADRGFVTRLLMPYLIFSGEETAMPEVGRTTAAEMLELYKLLENADCPADVRQMIDSASSHVNESWLELSLPAGLEGLKHKTGSMIDCGPDGDTVFNAAGSFTRHGRKFYFCLLSSGRLRDSQTVQPRQMSRQSASRLYDAVKTYC